MLALVVKLIKMLDILVFEIKEPESECLILIPVIGNRTLSKHRRKVS
jgi:hypothetical protein